MPGSAAGGAGHAPVFKTDAAPPGRSTARITINPALARRILVDLGLHFVGLAPALANLLLAHAGDHASFDQGFADALLVGLGRRMTREPAAVGLGFFAVLAGAALVGAFGWSQYKLTRISLQPGNWANDRGIDTPAFLIVYTEDRAAIGRAMAPCFQPADFSIVGGAGAQPYFGRMQGIDVFGLVSQRIAHEEPRVRPRAGHTKFGTDALLADYDPTFVFSCYSITKSSAPLPNLPCRGFWEARGYEQVSMKIPGLRQSGDLYTFLAKKARHFQCPGLVAR